MRTLKSEADAPSSGQWRTRNEVGSVDSSDTYISCKSQPFHSQGDLTADDLHDTVFEHASHHPAGSGGSAGGGGSSSGGSGVNDSNLYVNPLESPNGKGGSGVKGGRSLGTSPMDECKEFGSRTGASGSRGSLNETVKQRKTRFSQVSIMQYKFVLQLQIEFWYFRISFFFCFGIIYEDNIGIELPKKLSIQNQIFNPKV